MADLKRADSIHDLIAIEAKWWPAKTPKPDATTPDNCYQIRGGG